MSRRSKVSQLPAKIRIELDMMLKGLGYSDYVAVSDWLRAEGYHIGKSALWVYGQALQMADANGTITPTRREDLLLELGHLRLREHVILQQLTGLDFGA